MANENQNNGQNNEYFENRASTEEARFHVVPNGDEGWAVKREGEDEPVSTADSKDEAVSDAEQMAKESKTMVIIHSEHGQIEDQRNFEE